MAVDVKTLTIGSHVEYKGKQGRVLYISPGGDFMNCGIHTTDDCGLPANYHISGFEQIHPIPITPSLLKELGFEQDMRFAYGKAFKMERGEMWIGVSAMSKGFWRIEAMDDTYNYGNCTVRYLHEAESFLGLHNVELIRE